MMRVCMPIYLIGAVIMHDVPPISYACRSITQRVNTEPLGEWIEKEGGKG